jgi:hypothetical protein
MRKFIKDYLGIIGIVAFTMLCGLINEFGTPNWLSIVLLFGWPISAYVILLAQKKAMLAGMKFARENASDSQFFTGVWEIGCAVLWTVIIFGLAFVAPLDFVIWDPVVGSGGSLLWRVISYTIYALLFGIGTIMFFYLFCGILNLPIYLISKSIFPDNVRHGDYLNVWGNYCVLPLALFAYISQLIGAADYFAIMEYFLSLF